MILRLLASMLSLAVLAMILTVASAEEDAKPGKPSTDTRNLGSPAPELAERPAEEWLNSKPFKLADMQGKVVVLHFWTFGCINCVHNQPHYKLWFDKYSKKGVVMLGVHSPESPGERDVQAVAKSMKEKGLKYPVVLDNDGAIWKSWENKLWPTTYLIDKRGVVRYRWEGEMNWKTAKGEAFMRKKMHELLAEPNP